MIEISLYGNKQNVLGWIELFEQEKVPYKYKGNKIKTPSDVNVVVSDALDLKKFGTKVVIHEPVNITSSNKRAVALVNSFVDENNEIVHTGTTYAMLNKSIGTSLGYFKTHTAFNDDTFAVVENKKQIFHFNLNVSGCLNSYGFVQREVEHDIPNLELALQITPYDRAGILRFLKTVLLKAFERADIPYVHLWYYPDTSQSVFLFRQDVDYVDVDGVKRLEQVSKKHNIRGTYFVNIDGGEEYEDEDEHQLAPMPEPVTPKRAVHLKKLLESGNELANHGFMHTVYSGFEDSVQDLKSCNEYLSRLFNIKNVGYASPGGIYTTGLGKALNYCKFEYASNLTLGSGGFPYYFRGVVLDNSVLEIPYYIVCDACFDPFTDTKMHKELTEEFKRYIDKQLSRNEPVNIFGHPHFSGKIADTFYNEIFAKVNKLGIKNLTAKEFSAFWKKRAKKHINYSFKSGTLNLTTNDNNVVVVCVHYKALKKLIKVGSNKFETTL